jgi:hypothetical protein
MHHNRMTLVFVAVLAQVTLFAQISCATPKPTSAAAPAGITWGYNDGKWNWAGDFTQNGTKVDYHHPTDQGFNGHKHSILFTSSGPWGLFLPYFAPGSTGYRYPNRGWTNLLISLKPGTTGETFGIHMEKTGDVDPGCHLELLDYGPPTVAGQWGSYVIPLKDLCVSGDPYLYKVAIATHKDSASSWEMDAIGFQ